MGERMTRHANCPHCGGPLAIKLHVDAYESKWIMNDERKKKEAKELFDKQHKEVLISELDENGLLTIGESRQ